MRGCALGGQRRTSVRAFGAAGMTSLTNQDPNGACGSCRSGVLGCRSRFAARPLGWSDLDRVLELADGLAPCQISIPKPAFGGTISGLLGFASSHHVQRKSQDPQHHANDKPHCRALKAE